jgi:hypothetical protein
MRNPKRLRVIEDDVTVFVRELLKGKKRDAQLSAGHIELEAERLGVFGDIWPMKSQREYLRVDPEEAMRIATRKSVTRRRWEDRQPKQRVAS